MSLRITRLSLKDFRSYKILEVCPDEKLTVIVGPNATGKTNIIEALQLLTSTTSFRSPLWSECVRWGSPQSEISLEAEGEGRKIKTTLSITSSGKRSYRVNGTPKRKTSDVAAILPCVVFTPDDLRLVKDSAERRRSALDGVGDQLSPAYAAMRAEYDRIVRQRNALLREESPDSDLMQTLTLRLIEKGVAFSGHRRRLFGRMATKLSEAYSTLSTAEEIVTTYISSWERPEVDTDLSPEEQMRLSLALRETEERARKTTLVGPHRDEIFFLINGRDSRSYASQGQQRTIALAWKLAEVRVITEVARQSPVLLLDDVMSELDQSRRHTLASLVGEVAQTFVTTTNLGYFEDGMIARAKVVELS